MREKIHFAHGNGFPSACYRQLFIALEARYDCDYIDKVGHNPSFPVTENWDSLVDELIHSIKSKYQEPVIGLGHSLGGVLNFLASMKEPSLFKSVVMIDSPLLGRFKSRMIRLAKSLGLIDQITPAAKTRWRKTHWKTREQLFEYLKSRPLFSSFTDACLQDFMDYGVRPTADGHELIFDRNIEYQIFRTIPHHLPHLKGTTEVPTALIYGDKSNVVDSYDLRLMSSKYGIKSYKINGGHMVPMEHPEALAELIFKVLSIF